MDSKMIGLIAVIVVVVAAVGAYVILADSDEGHDDVWDEGGSVSVSFGYDTGVRLAIFGNANGDDYINEDDLKLLKKLISGDVNYDPKVNSFADTNADGVLDSRDVELLEKIIKKEPCTMYYWNCAKSVASIQYPLTGTIGTHHMYPIDAMIILGLYDRVVATSHQTFQNSISVDGLRYPGMGTKIVDVGSPWEDCQAAVKAGVNIWIEGGSSASRNYSTYKTVADAAGLNLQVINLYITTYDVRCTEQNGSLLMLGVMFQCEEAAHKYIDWTDGVDKYISESTSKLDKDWTFLTPMGSKSANDISLDTVYTNGNMMGDVYTVSRTGMKSVNTVVDSGCPAISMEEIYRLNPDVIVIIMFQTSDKSIETIQSEFDAYAEIYKNTSAYKNGNIYGVNYYNIASYAGSSELILLSSYIWPDIFDEKTGWEYLQYYYDNFTMYRDVDISKMGNALPFRMS